MKSELGLFPAALLPELGLLPEAFLSSYRVCMHDDRIGGYFDCCVRETLTKAERRSSSSNVTALSFFLAAIDVVARCLLGNSLSAIVADFAWSPNCTCQIDVGLKRYMK